MASTIHQTHLLAGKFFHMGYETETGMFLKIGSDLTIKSVTQAFIEKLDIIQKEVIGLPLSSIGHVENEVQFGEIISVDFFDRDYKPTYSCVLIPSSKKDTSVLDYRVYFDYESIESPYSRSNEVAFKAVFDHAAIGVALVSTEGRILQANDSFQSYIEYSEEELQQMSFPEFTHPEDIDKDVEYYTQLLDDKIKDYQLEKRYITKSGKIIWVHISVSLVRDSLRNIQHAVAAIQNIDESKKLDIELKEYQTRLEKAFEGAKEAVFHWPDVQKDKLWWSPNFQSILGYTKDEFESSVPNFFRILHPKDKSIVEQGLSDLFEKNKEYNVDYRLKAKNGRYRWFNATGKVERDNDGNPTQMIGFIADIDHLKKTQNTLTTRNRALERSNKELENFANVASHDLQEPLRTITSFIQLFQLSIENELSEESKTYLKTVEKASKRMRLLIEDLLAYSKIDLKKSENEPIDTQKLVATVVSDISVRIQEGDAKVEFENLLPVLGEKSKLYRLFKNLIVNAIKFKDPSRPAVVKIHSKADGKRIRFEVIDNGIGIAKEHHDKVFEIFQRLHTREEYAGSGIGLSVCRKIVDLYNGRISISSNPKEGVCVSFDLPKTLKL